MKFLVAVCTVEHRWLWFVLHCYQFWTVHDDLCQNKIIILYYVLCDARNTEYTSLHVWNQVMKSELYLNTYMDLT